MIKTLSIKHQNIILMKIEMIQAQSFRQNFGKTFSRMPYLNYIYYFKLLFF